MIYFVYWYRFVFVFHIQNGGMERSYSFYISKSDRLKSDDIDEIYFDRSPHGASIVNFFCVILTVHINHIFY